MDDDLKRLRDQIDALDDELLKLVNRRAALAQDVGRIKNGMVYRAEREAQVLERIKRSNPGPLPEKDVARLFAQIISSCRAMEQELSMAYLGPRGTYSEAAAVQHFGEAARGVPCDSIDDVFRDVEAEQVDYGVVPVENSTEGAIGRTLDLLLQTPLKVCGEVVLPVHHCFLSKTEPPAIRAIYSHAQSLGQCHEWLNRNYPNAGRVAVASNAEAARLAAERDGSAAIAGKLAGELYGLNALAENIEDDPRNTTRFLVVGRHDAGVSGKDKTSLAMSAKNRPGAVYGLLAPLAQHGVSMTKLESRPARTGLWEYVFFVDIDGHRSDAAVARALAEIDERAVFLKVLGSYPQAVL
jgi:chorismate mutase/prephenate dehydratase